MPFYFSTSPLYWLYMILEQDFFFVHMQDSPVFNYINNLSPIKPLNSQRSFNLLSFASPKTPIALPATNCPQKSKTTSGTHLFCPLKPEIPDGKTTGKKSQVIADGLQPMGLNAGEADYLDSCVGVTTNASNKLLESALDACQSTNNDLGISLMETEGEQDYLGSGAVLKVANAPDEQAELSTELHHCITSDHGGCDCKSDPENYNSVSQTVDSETSTKFFIQESPGNVESSFRNTLALQEVQVGQMRGVGCRWDKMLIEDTDQLLCDSPINERDPEEMDRIYVDPGTSSFIENILQLSQDNIDEVSFEDHDVQVPLASPNEAEKHSEAGQALTCASNSDKAVSNSNAEVEDKPCPQQQQMLPRRCLVFEMSGNHYRKLMSDTGGTSLITEQSDHTAVTSEKRLVSSKRELYNISSLLPGIGLHLNTLATTRRDKIVVKQEATTYKRQLMGMPCTTPSLHSTSSDSKPVDSALDTSSMEKDSEPSKKKGMLNENTTGSLELKPSSTKRKRSKLDIAGEGDTCKRCNCKRSKCLKLYCECFAAGLYCVEPCSCQGCLNKPAFEETVLETRRLIEARNPLAFAPKVIRISDVLEYGDEINTTPASARHKRGCNCKKSGCLKKYCECFQGGVGCSLSCRCEGCRNSFGRKDGADSILLEETEASEDNSADVSFPEGVVKVEVEHRDPQVISCSQISSGLLQPCTNHGVEKRTKSFSRNGSFVVPTPREMTIEDEPAKTLKVDNDTSTTTSVKSMSPNCKRVSPHLGLRHSPVRKFCRKLILRSIPSFPKLSEPRENDMSEQKPS